VNPEKPGEDKVPTGIALTYFGDIKPILDKSCGACHGIPSLQDLSYDFTLSFYDDVEHIKGVKSILGLIGSSISDGTMPPSSPLAAVDKQRILTWIEQGGPRGDGQDEAHPEASVNFLNPPDGQTVLASESITIQLQRVKWQRDASVSLYYTSEPDSTDGDMAIVENYTGGSMSFDWNTSDVRPGLYSIRAVVKQGDALELTKLSQGIVEVSRQSILKLTSHQGETLMLNNSSQTITWTIDNSGGYDLRYRVEYSHFDDEYKPIPGGESVSGLSFLWDISDVSTYVRDFRYKVRVTAFDSRNPSENLVSSESPKGFAIAATTPTYWQDVYPTLSGCAGCHGSAGADVAYFNMDDYAFTPQGAFQKQNILISSLGVGGSMPKGNPETFDPLDFGLIKMWKWGGAAEGVVQNPSPVVNLTSLLGNELVVNGPSSATITWATANTSSMNVRYVVEYKNPLDGLYRVIPGAESLTVQNFVWDTSDTNLYPQDDKYKIRVRLVDAGDLSLKSISESPEFFGIGTKNFSYLDDIKPRILAAGCGGCHNGSVASGGVNFDDFATINASGLIRSVGPSGTMPPGAPGTFPNADLQLLTLWNWGGARP
jgi:hypothetical protein